MNYDLALAKKLHKGGFPNIGIYRHCYVEEQNDDTGKPGWDKKSTCKSCGKIEVYASGGMTTSDFFYGCPVVSNYRFPTLSELIEECQKDVSGIIMIDKFGDKKRAKCTTPEIAWVEGYSNEEAISNLWLELNK